MGAAIKYRQYPDAVKLEVARTANPYRFPELRIPRTTAIYWIKCARKLQKRSVEFTESLRIKELEDEVSRNRALLNLVNQVRQVFPHAFGSRNVVSKPMRRRIVEFLQEAAKWNGIDECLKVVGLSQRLYAQWLSEFFLCQNGDSSCEQRKPQQLTVHEIQTMKRLVASRKYSHIPIASLCLLAQRMGVLFCSIDSWYKYIRIFGW